MGETEERKEYDAGSAASLFTILFELTCNSGVTSK